MHFWLHPVGELNKSTFWAIKNTHGQTWVSMKESHTHSTLKKQGRYGSIKYQVYQVFQQHGKHQPLVSQMFLPAPFHQGAASLECPSLLPNMDTWPLNICVVLNCCVFLCVSVCSTYLLKYTIWYLSISISPSPSLSLPLSRTFFLSLSFSFFLFLFLVFSCCFFLSFFLPLSLSVFIQARKKSPMGCKNHAQMVGFWLCLPHHFFPSYSWLRNRPIRLRFTIRACQSVEGIGRGGPWALIHDVVAQPDRFWGSILGKKRQFHSKKRGSGTAKILGFHRALIPKNGISMSALIMHRMQRCLCLGKQIWNPKIAMSNA